MQEDIAGLDVSMDHALAVRIVQRPGHRHGDLESFLDWELCLALDLVA